MIDKDGFEPCLLCKRLYHISDPATFEMENGSVSCRDCFVLIANKTSWHCLVKPKIVFEYKKVSIPHSVKWEVWKRDGFSCKTCGETDNLSVDHIKPESYGGTLELSNLQTLCRSCNSRKSNKI